MISSANPAKGPPPPTPPHQCPTFFDAGPRTRAERRGPHLRSDARQEGRQAGRQRRRQSGQGGDVASVVGLQPSRGRRPSPGGRHGGGLVLSRSRPLHEGKGNQGCWLKRARECYNAASIHRAFIFLWLPERTRRRGPPYNINNLGLNYEDFTQLILISRCFDHACMHINLVLLKGVYIGVYGK